MIELREYLNDQARSPFGRWFEALDAQAATRIAVALGRMEAGNFSNAKAIGDGVNEYKVDFGPCYRIYFGREGSTVIILLSGGTKKRQQRDIEMAKMYWADYKKRKSSGIGSWR